MIGLLADKIGGIKIAKLASILFLILSVPLFYSIVHLPMLAIAAVYLFALLTTLTAGATPGLLVETLKPETRCTIFSFTFNICYGVFGGLTPVIGFLLIDKVGSKMAPVYYLMFAALVTLVATFFLSLRRRRHEEFFC